ncbi:hypothetical protein [Botrimarina mediterranea]|uniref:Uncharacterized protein n=1 Tax=Botrimarina mediterranea TaxID=2528022 RepID=A0A518K615_9BACT|nr:hypothetical protein [Botrimarina mediterranea]QDV73231.1 hypothetical protein Spa11_14270 [Botrimarina mediterranea]
MSAILRRVFLTGIVLVFFALVSGNVYGFADSVERVIAWVAAIYFIAAFIVWGRQILELFLDRVGF